MTWKNLRKAYWGQEYCRGRKLKRPPSTTCLSTSKGTVNLESHICQTNHTAQQEILTLTLLKYLHARTFFLCTFTYF